MDLLVIFLFLLLAVFAVWGGLSLTPLLFLVLIVAMLLLVFGSRRW